MKSVGRGISGGPRRRRETRQQPGCLFHVRGGGEKGSKGREPPRARREGDSGSCSSPSVSFSPSTYIHTHTTDTEQAPRLLTRARSAPGPRRATGLRLLNCRLAQRPSSWSCPPPSGTKPVSRRLLHNCRLREKGAGLRAVNSLFEASSAHRPPPARVPTRRPACLLS